MASSPSSAPCCSRSCRHKWKLCQTMRSPHSQFLPGIVLARACWTRRLLTSGLNLHDLAPAVDPRRPCALQAVPVAERLAGGPHLLELGFIDARGPSPRQLDLDTAARLYACAAQARRALAQMMVLKQFCGRSLHDVHRGIRDPHSTRDMSAVIMQTGQPVSVMPDQCWLAAIVQWLFLLKSRKRALASENSAVTYANACFVNAQVSTLRKP